MVPVLNAAPFIETNCRTSSFNGIFLISEKTPAIALILELEIITSGWTSESARRSIFKPNDESAITATAPMRKIASSKTNVSTL